MERAFFSSASNKVINWHKSAVYATSGGDATSQLLLKDHKNSKSNTKPEAINAYKCPGTTFA